MEEEEESKGRVQYSQWLKRANNTFLPTDNSRTQKQIDAGVYDIRHAKDIGYYLLKKEITLDELIDLPFPEGREVIYGIEKFWQKQAVFKKYGYAYKRGVLLYGVPGGGKTSIISLLCDKLIKEKNGVVFYISNPDDLTRYTYFMPEVYRAIEPERPLITIIEDIDGLCMQKEHETMLINVLDGLEQIENVVYIATTNYTERLSDRIINRPNRFDRRIEIKSPNTECRKMYFERKLKPEDLEKIDLSKWVEKTEGLTMASLGELVKSVMILDENFEDTLERLGGMKNIPTSRNYNKDFKENLGYKPNGLHTLLKD